MAARVRSAREIQKARHDGEDPRGNGEGSIGRALWSCDGAAFTNARAAISLIRRCATPDAPGRRLLESAMTRLALSARGHGRILRVARTIADLEGCEAIRAAHIAEAIQYRYMDRPVEAAGAPS